MWKRRTEPGLARGVLARCAPGVAVALALALPGAALGQEGGDLAGFAQRLATALSERDADTLEEAFDREAFLDGVLSGIAFPRMMQAQYRAESGGDLSLVEELWGGSRSRPTFRLVRLEPSEDGARALYRSWDGSRYDLLELALRPGAAGRGRVVDAERPREGRSLAQTWRLDYVMTYARDMAGLIKRLPEPEKSWVRSARQLESFDHLRGTGDVDGAERALLGLPAALRDERATHYMRMELAAEREGAELFLRALGSCREAHPDDLGAELHALDYFEAQEGDNHYLFALARLQELVGMDGALDCLRAARYLAAGNRRSAGRAYQAAIDHEPELPDGYWGRIALALEDGDHRSIVGLLLGLEQSCGVQLGDLSQRPEFEAFVSSKFHARWLKRRK